MDELGTLDRYLTECGYVQTEGALIPQIEMVGLEKYSANMVLKCLWPLCLCGEFLSGSMNIIFY